MKKHKDLQPWLEYFEMLRRYKEKGLLHMQPDKHEAYVTEPALHAMSPGNDPQKQMTDGSIFRTVRRLRTYAAWLLTEEKSYFNQPFAVNVVKDEPPHDPLYTIVMERRRKWWRLWMLTDCIEVIDYGMKNEE